MDLKFTFGGASSDDSRDGAPSGIPLPFSTSPTSSSSVLEVRVLREGDELRADALSGDGVSYADALVAVESGESAALALAVRSAVSRCVAGLEGPLADAVSALVLDLGGDEVAVLGEFGIAAIANDDPEASVAVVSDSFQRRTGVASGTPIRIASKPRD